MRKTDREGVGGQIYSCDPWCHMIPRGQGHYPKIFESQYLHNRGMLTLYWNYVSSPSSVTSHYFHPAVQGRPGWVELTARTASYQPICSAANQIPKISITHHDIIDVHMHCTTLLWSAKYIKSQLKYFNIIIRVIDQILMHTHNVANLFKKFLLHLKFHVSNFHFFNSSLSLRLP